MSATTTQANVLNFKNRIIFAPLGPIARYHLRYTLILSSVPVICGAFLLLLMNVFAKLNLYFLESNGLIVDDQVRDAYFSQVQIEMMSVVGYLVLLLVVTTIVSIVVMRWASAPFTSANRTLETALAQPDNLRPLSRWLSESSFFDRVIWLFALRVKSGGENQVKNLNHAYAKNIFFLLKFSITFIALSILTGYMTGITIGEVYRRVVELAVVLVNKNGVSSAQHYFIAQEEVLRDCIKFLCWISIMAYFLIGLRISKHMNLMINVFTKAIEDDRFPIQLRSGDIYVNLAQTLNRAREKIR